MTALNPFREAQPRITAFDDGDRMKAGYNAWEVWLGAAQLARLPDKDFNAEAMGYMRSAAALLTAKLVGMK